MVPRNTPARDDLVLVGAVLGAFGVQGEVRVRAFTATPKGLAAYGPLLNAAGEVLLTPVSVRALKDDAALRAREVRDRDAAEALKGAGLFVPRAALPPAQEDEYYHVDLIGCAVETLTGAPLGTVKAVQNFGAGDLLEIVGPNGRGWFLAFTQADLPIVDIANKRLVSAQAEPRAGPEDQREEPQDDGPA